MSIKTTAICDMCGREVSMNGSEGIPFGWHYIRPLSDDPVLLCKNCTNDVQAFITSKRASREEGVAPPCTITTVNFIFRLAHYKKTEKGMLCRYYSHPGPSTQFTIPNGFTSREVNERLQELDDVQVKP